MSETIFSVTQEHLETGLRGYPVGYCTTSFVDPQKGLFYIDEPISKLVDLDPLDVVHMLYSGKRASKEDLDAFKADIQKRAHLEKETLKTISTLPKNGHPMKIFVCALITCGMLEGTDNYQEDCLNLIAKIPLIVAASISHHAGWKLNPSDPEKGYIENFTDMLSVPDSSKEDLLRAFKTFNKLHYDHGGGNLSAFVGKSVASGLEDLYGSAAASMCALEGPRHGKANQDCLEFTQEILEKLGEEASVDDVANLLREKLSKKELIYGFGHAVLRVEDPRASIFYESAQKHYSNNPLIKMALLLREAGPKVLKENPKISNPYPNVDAISGALLSAAGFNYPQYYTVLFGMSRVVGISIQILYERNIARGGKGVPIYRPKYFFKGKA
ncbi:MAG: Citrate synthase [Chlamydiae bacterium]|nr:Citrate synthase [Chlamydiota bacterium]